MGDVKYHTHHTLLKQMRGDKLPVYLGYEAAVQAARDVVAKKK